MHSVAIKFCKFFHSVNPDSDNSNGGNYTKHVYMGSQRITSKVSNSGIFSTSPVNDTLQAKYQLQTAKIKERFDNLDATYSGVQQTGGLVSASPATTADSYFYHPDHLGSSSLITDGSGHTVQHIQYVPFGEVFVEQRNNTWNTPYKFNGKELDEETGLAYYHARYYDPRTSVWLSVDPLKGKTLNVSAYVFCYNNPVRYVDPDGRFSSEFWSNVHRFFHGGDRNGKSYETKSGVWGYNSFNPKAIEGGAYYITKWETPKLIYSMQKGGYVFFGTSSTQSTKWPGAEYIFGCIDASPFLYPISNPTSKAETIYESLKKADFIMDYMFKVGVKMDIPEMNEPNAIKIETISSPVVLGGYAQGDSNYKDENGNVFHIGDTLEWMDVKLTKRNAEIVKRDTTYRKKLKTK